MSGIIHKPIDSAPNTPLWDLPDSVRGWEHWNEDDYLAFDENILVEFSNGKAEILPMPTLSHQLILAYLYGKLLTYVTYGDLGTVLFPAYKVRLWEGQYREPDLVFMKVENSDRLGEAYCEAADLVMEVVSENRAHDLVTKRREYAEAGIPEYWTVDPQEGRITVLRLETGSKVYTEHGVFMRGDLARSALLPGFEIDVNSALSPKR